jgi:hypothetical protein
MSVSNLQIIYGNTVDQAPCLDRLQSGGGCEPATCCGCETLEYRNKAETALLRGNHCPLQAVIV